MIITTATKTDGQISSCSIFDTQTGIKYNLLLDEGHEYRPSRVNVEIYSAHVHSNEIDYPGVNYYNTEAIHFWQQLIDGLFSEDSATVPNDALRAARKLLSQFEAYHSQYDDVKDLF